MQPRNVVSKIKIEGLFDNQSIDWEIPKEQVISVLVGRNGSGKSTILGIIRDLFTGSNIVDSSLYRKVTLVMGDEEELFLHSKAKIDLGLENLESRSHEDNLIKELKKSLIDYLSLIDNAKRNADFDNEATAPRLNDYDIDLMKLDKIFSKIYEGNRDILVKRAKVNLTYISTIDMLANSIREFKDSSGIKVNYLNQEINSTIKVICKSKNKLIVQILEKTLNSFFEESCKKVLISDGDILVTTESGKELSLDRLSSGERQLIYIFVKVAIAATKKHQLILMDEPEISLHMSWQKKLLSSLKEINSVSQMIIVTHSPAIVLKGWRDSYVDIKEISGK